MDEAFHLGHQPLPAQTEVIGALDEVMDARDVVVQAAGACRATCRCSGGPATPKQYHVEYGYSCMGYEIAGALGIKMAAPDREVFALVGDGSYLMMAQEIVTAVSEGIKLNLVIVQNHGFASIGALSESLGSQRFGTNYRYRDPETGMLTATSCRSIWPRTRSLGADVIRVTDDRGVRAAIATPAPPTTTVVHIETDPLAPVPCSESWWDVPVSEVVQRSTAPNRRARPTRSTSATRSP